MTGNITSAYEQLAGEILTEGHLGHGIQEDLLLDSARWFGRPLTAGNASFGDFFRAAMEHHIGLLSAVDLDIENERDCLEFLGFLRYLLRWISGLPQDVVRKSPKPLMLVIGWHGALQQFGAQVMRRGGPSVIYWGAFRSLRSCLHLGSYRRLAELIWITLAHELIGHQLAFCTHGGPLLSRDDLRDIVTASHIRFLKLVDSSSMSAEAFLALPDLLAAVARVRYYGPSTDMRRYCSNLAEVIAFAVAGNPPEANPCNGDVQAVLRRGLLREQSPLACDSSSATMLYRGYDFSKATFPAYFVERSSSGWRETQAVAQHDRWMTLTGLFDAFRFVSSHKQPGERIDLQSGKKLFLNAQSANYVLEVGAVRLLISPFGVFDPAQCDAPLSLPYTLRSNATTITLARHPGDDASIVVTSDGGCRVAAHLLPVPYAGIPQVPKPTAGP